MGKKITIALAGNANVGKSVIFNYLTGLHQHIGNWPGKTVERKEGTLNYKDYTIDVFDLPGIYSLATFTLEEVISRQYITSEKPNVVVNVVDATALERNLIFTLQLLELEVPIIIVLNQMDLAEAKGIKIDSKKLEKLLGIPVIETVAIKGKGIDQILEKSIQIVEGKISLKALKSRYSHPFEKNLEKLVEEINLIKTNYPSRWIAIKLLEGDPEIKDLIGKSKPEITFQAVKYLKELEKIFGESNSLLIKTERCKSVNKIVKEVQQLIPPKLPSFSERVNNIAIHKFWGYLILVLIVVLIFLTIFKLGNFLSGFMIGWFEIITSFYQTIFGTGKLASIVLGGLEGLLAGIAIALPYIIPFYIVFGLLEDSGYLSRIAFLVDNIMHRMGLHGKAFIPLMLGYGCNIPAILGCRIMETQRERLICGFIASLIPCAARTVIILGLVGKFVGLPWAIALYIFDLLVVFILGRIAFKVLPGEPTGLIMEMHDLRIPHFKTIFKQAWFRVKDFIYFAFPLIIIGSVLIKFLEVVGWLESIANFFSPVTAGWLGLPIITGVVLIFGILRKELALIMLATLLGTANFAVALTPLQMFVFALVCMFYIFCLATIAVLIKEFGWQKAITITAFEIIFAFGLGGIVFRLLSGVL